MRLALSLMVLVVVAQPAFAEAPIIGGSVDSGDPAVVLLAAYPTDRSTLYTCTAVVIADKTLLTAAHCLDHPGYLFGVYFGADASAYTTLAQLEPQLAAVSDVHIHPQYSRSSPFYGDIGVAMLSASVPSTVTPLAIARTAPTSTLTGATVRIVGYGQTTYNTPNQTRYAATTTVAALESDDTIKIGDSTKHTCVGDSGGPALLGDTVIGVDSYTNTTGCTEPAFFRRTDAFLPFIDQYAPPAADQPDAGVSDPPNDPPPMTPSDNSGCNAGGPGSSLLVLLTLVGAWRRRASKRSR